jgi:hypothetical protein
MIKQERRYHAQQEIFGRDGAVVLRGRAGAGVAQGQPVVGIQTVTTYYSDGRITAVDPTARTVTVTFPNGATRTHNVSPAVANFSATRIGDTVTVGFEDRLTFVLSGSNSSLPRESNDVAAGAITRGQRVTGDRSGRDDPELVGGWRRSERRHT